MKLKGDILRDERLKRGLSVEEVAQATRIRPRFIRAMEEGRTEELPPGILAKGFVRAYARFLGINPEEVLQQQPPPPPPPRPRTRALRMLRVLPLAMAAFGLLLWGTFKGRKEGPPAREPQGAVSEPNTLNLTLPLPGIPPSPVPKEHVLEIVATELTWIEIKKGDEPPYDITLYPGDRYSVKDPKGFSLKIGNAGGIKLIFDGKELGKLGERGQVVRIRLP